MLIAIDGNEANVENRVGVNTFAFNVLWSLQRLKAKGKMPKAIKFKVFLNREPLEDLPPEKDWWKYEVFGAKIFWTWTALVKRLYFGKPRPDIIYSPSHYGPGFSPIPSVISIMDLGFLRWPEQFTKRDFLQLKYWTKWSAKRAQKIITISKFSKNDILETYGVEAEKVVVAYPGFKKQEGNKATKQQSKIQKKYRKQQGNKATKQQSKILKKYKIDSKYILYLGTLKPSKNIDGLIKALRILVTSHKHLATSLVIAGKKGWLYQDLFELVKELNLDEKVIFTGFVKDEEVKPLMEKAEVFVLPSFWEGFGIPVLEAMDADTPVVCSNRASLPEVVGKAALLVDPDSPDDIAQKISQVLKNKQLKNDLVELGKKQVKKYSWEKCAEKILKTIVETSRDLSLQNNQ